MEIIAVYVTFPNLESAEQVVQESLKKNLVACVNLIPQVISCFKWKGKINKEKEVIGLFKTVEANYERLQGVIKKKHPYDCPAIVALPIQRSDELFKNWVLNETTTG